MSSTECYSSSPKVSVIIPTVNRFDYLLDAIRSVKSQTYPNVEIIVINDGSTDKVYYEHDFGEICVIHLDPSSRKVCGFPSVGYVRNIGVKAASGEYMAFLDDDDTWLPEKLEKQMQAMGRTGCGMSCTEALAGYGRREAGRKYDKFIHEYHYSYLKDKYLKHGVALVGDTFPELWKIDFLRIHNCCITSSIIVKKEIFDKIEGMKHVEVGKEDYDCWLRLLECTNCVFVVSPCLYYDCKASKWDL